MTCRTCDHSHARHINGAYGVYCAPCLKAGKRNHAHDCDGDCCISAGEWTAHVDWRARMGFAS